MWINPSPGPLCLNSLTLPPRVRSFFFFKEQDLNKSVDSSEEGGCCLVANLCSTLRGPTYCSLPGSSVHWILKARILECIAVSFSRGSSQPRDWTQVSCVGRWIFYRWATRESPWKRVDPLTTDRFCGTHHLLCEPGIWDRCQSPSMNSPFRSRGGVKCYYLLHCWILEKNILLAML